MLAALKSVDFSMEEELEDLMVEIDILNECKHPNILQLHEAYVFGKKIWVFLIFLHIHSQMYLEYCGGGAVDNIMKTLDKPLTEPQIKFISHEVISGLAFLHRHLIIHRDLKAGNILITSNYEIRLGTFLVALTMGCFQLISVCRHKWQMKTKSAQHLLERRIGWLQKLLPVKLSKIFPMMYPLMFGPLVCFISYL